jgi:hypothetical protein
MNKISLTGKIAALFALLLASLGSTCEITGPFIKSTNPGALTITPQNIMVLNLNGVNFALPTTTGYTFQNDIQVYFRYFYPDVREWVQIPPPNFAAWSNTLINVQLPPTRAYIRPQLAVTEEGQIQFKVVVRTVGESNNYVVDVNGVPGSPHIHSTYPAFLPYTPSNTQAITLWGERFTCPDTNGYNFQTDIQVYFRYVDPSLTQWTQLPPPYFAGWSGTQIVIDLLGAGASGPYRLPSVGKVQFKVVSRCHGVSNVQTVDVR